MNILNKKSLKRSQNTQSQQSWLQLIGKNRTFALEEAAKRLRTNVMFSFSEESSCRVIGVTSTLMNEGKSTTSINLAYDLMKAGKKVLLIDADMRLSQFEKHLSLIRSPGLSNMLVGENNGEKLVQHVHLLDDLSVISCGDYPPNPTELLASKRMETLCNVLRAKYNYIIIDLPPVSQVSDALIVSKLTDGMILVVKQDYTDKRLLDDTIRQLRFHEANIIGFVMTCAKTEGNGYYHYKYKDYQR